MVAVPPSPKASVFARLRTDKMAGQAENTEIYN